MKIEIYDMWRNGHTIYFWTLYDGPDGIDKVTGYATTLEETVCKILDWRQRIGEDYAAACEELPVLRMDRDDGEGPSEGPDA